MTIPVYPLFCDPMLEQKPKNTTRKFSKLVGLASISRQEAGER